MIERRKAQRSRVKRETVVRIRASLQARIINISSCGALLELETPLHPSRECDLRFFHHSGDELRVRARIHRCRLERTGDESTEKRELKYRAGVEFLYADEESCARVVRRVAELVRAEDTAPVSVSALE